MEDLRGFFPTIEFGVGRVVTKGEDFHAEHVNVDLADFRRKRKGAAGDEPDRPKDRELAPGGAPTTEGNGHAAGAEGGEALPNPSIVANFSYFGVFDGHGGKGSAKFCSESLLGLILDEGATAGAQAPEEHGDEARVCMDALSDDEVREIDAQEKFVATLPDSLDAAFKGADSEWKGKDLPSGTTATVALITGWELVCASVGDSCAYFHTGKQLLQVSGNHRIEEDKSSGKVIVTEEITRVRSSGGSIARAEIEGKAVGPLRIWPGGLAMTRTIGDRSAEDVSSSEPEIRHLTMPQEGGRLIMASDGLWDAITPKQAFSLIKGTQATKAAATKLCKASVKALGKRDDISESNFLPPSPSILPSLFALKH